MNSTTLNSLRGSAPDGSSRMRWYIARAAVDALGLLGVKSDAVVGALVGGTLGIVGAAYQTIFGNPLATPSTVGTTAGAVLGALAAVVLLGGGTIGGVPVLALAAFAGALVVTLVVAMVASSGRASTRGGCISLTRK